MPETSMTGLLYSLPITNPYDIPECVPVPLTGVRINVRVVNFIAQVSTYNLARYIGIYMCIMHIIPITKVASKRAGFLR